jgi:DNA polymerase-3 subunit beta
VKVSCSQETLAQGISTVGRAVAPRSTLPVLGNILLSTDNGRLKLAATNLDLGVTCWIEADIAEPGATTVPARLLNEFVNSLPKERVVLALNQKNNTLNLKCAAYEANVRGIDAEEFPAIAQGADHFAVQVDPEVLHDAISSVVFAAATDESRPQLTGVLLSFRGVTLTLAAADGFRLAVQTLTLTDAAPEDLDIIVPAKALQELARVLSDQEEPVRVSVTANRGQVLFQLKNVEIVSRLIEANFPNYKQIIPTSYTTRVVLSTKEFQNAIRIASFFARDANNIVKLQVANGEAGEPGRVVVAATATDVGDTVAGIDAVVEGDSTQIAFNSKYLADALGVLSSQQIALECTSPARPGVLRPVGVEGYTYVVMPMHLAQK